MPLNKHVMTSSYREGLTKAYRNALIDSGVGADKAEIKPHILGTATVTLTEVQLAKLRDKRGEELVELTGHGNNGQIEILLPEGIAYLEKNRPTLTDEEREAKKRKADGSRAASAEEAQKRKEARERMAQMLKDRFGIDLSENKADAETDADSE